jgi:hypothetical protein
MRLQDISAEASETYGRLSPKTTYQWIRRLVVLVAVLLAPWFLIPWRYALLYVLLALYIMDEVDGVGPIIVALAKQELMRTREH